MGAGLMVPTVHRTGHLAFLAPSLVVFVAMTRSFLFTPAAPHLVNVSGLSNSPTSVKSADFDSDDKADLVAAISSGTLSFLGGAGDGTFVSYPDQVLGGQLNDVVLADFNGDCSADVGIAGDAPDEPSVFETDDQLETRRATIFDVAGEGCPHDWAQQLTGSRSTASAPWPGSSRER